METSRLSRLFLIVASLVAAHTVRTVIAQGPPPPLQPLAAPVAPAGNPITVDKTQLGKALFWDEQLSSTRTVACGTCHQPVAGGSDPRSSATTLHPGPNGTFGNGDDIVGSPGVISTTAAGQQQLADFFAMTEQITGRYSPTVINSAYPSALFWDGRATGTFTDPVSGQVVLATGAALESQAAGPPTSDVEMAHAGRDWAAVATRLEHAVPLALSPSVPADLTTWIAGRNYAQLFQAAFGSAGVTPSRIIMAIATYERSLVSNQAPIDAFIAGTPGALTAQEQQGQNLFRTHGCAGCHAGNRFTDDAFHYIGVRPQGEDLGRFNVTGVNGNRGQFKTPTLRNVALRGEFMHNGRLGSLEEVVEFYNRGGDFNAPNKPPVIQPLGLTDTEKAALVAFLGRPLTDPRVAAETGPFSRPALSAKSSRTPVVTGTPVADELGNLPLLAAVEPPLAGSANFTVGLSRVPVGRQVWLVIDDAPIPSGGGVPAEGAVKYRFSTTASGGTSWDTVLGTDHSGYASVALAIPGGAALDGVTLHGRWFVDGGAGIGESASFAATIFGETAGTLSAPTGLEATRDLLNQAVDLSWNAVSGATRYDIYRSATSTFGDAVFVISRTTTTYTDDEGDLGSGDYYWVVAVNADETSAPTAAERADGLSYDGFTIDVTDGGFYDRNVISWQQHFPSAVYRIRRGTSADPEAMTTLAEGHPIQIDDTEATPLRLHYYQVELLDEEGNLLGRSLVDSGFRKLGAPAGLTASDAIFDNRIALSWNAADGAGGYRILRRIGTGETTLWQTVSGTSVDDTAAPAGIDVHYQVQSLNAYGEGDTSATVTGRRHVTNPGGLTVSLGSSPGELALTWEASEGAESYVIYRGNVSDSDEAVAIGTSATTTFLDINAAPGGTYHYWVAAVDEGVETDFGGIPVSGTSGSAIVDLHIESDRGSFLGDGIFNLSGSGQTRSEKIRRWSRLSVTVRAENDGTLTDALSYAGIGKNRSVRLTCLRTSPTSENLTAALIVGLAKSGELTPGASESLEIRLQPERTAAAKKKKSYRLSYHLRSLSGLSAGAADVVKLNIAAK